MNEWEKVSDVNDDKYWCCDKCLKDDLEVGKDDCYESKNPKFTAICQNCYENEMEIEND
jgi:hypothetical protein